MVHGTGAWPGNWWYPGGDFHEYIRTTVRDNVYAEGDTYAWSGRYSTRHRRVAARRLDDWRRAKKLQALDTVFAHSYGGGVALMSTVYGVTVSTLVLLSVPVESYEVEWRNVGRAVSLRIHCDLVLLAARRRQRFLTNVEENFLPDWFIKHSASHEVNVWKTGDWAQHLAL